MRPMKIQIPEATVQRWLALHRAGWNFARIGKEAGTDRRIVSRLVRRYEAAGMKEATATARRDVASRLLEKHFQELELAAETLLRLVSPPAFSTTFYLDTLDVWKALKESLAASHLAGKVYMPGHVPDAMDSRRAQRQTEAMVEALMEHQPAVVKEVKDWSLCAANYYRLWMALEARAVAAGMSRAAVRSDLDEALRRLKGDGMPAWLSVDGDAQAMVGQLLGLLRQLEKSFLSLEAILEPGPLSRALLGTQCRLCPA
mgnify:CR=1 FL=1